MTYELTRVFAFLNELAQHNNKVWFQAHKGEYEAALNEVVALADGVLEELGQGDLLETPSGKKSLHRIYRDIRFSKDKTPYKQNFSGSFKRATAALRGGYYFHLEPGNTFVAGGFWGPNASDLLHLRKQIAQDDSLLRNVLTSASFKSDFGVLLGEQLKTAPKGFEKEHPAVDLLRYKNYIVKKTFSDDEVLASNFHLQLAAGFKAMRPFFDVMSEYLTTDLNGVSLLEKAR